MKLTTLVLWSIMATTAWSQQQAPATAQLTPTERIALDSIKRESNRIANEQQQLLQELRSIEEDIRKAHPGLELDEKTLTLVPIRAQQPPPAKK